MSSTNNDETVALTTPTEEKKDSPVDTVASNIKNEKKSIDQSTTVTDKAKATVTVTATATTAIDTTENNIPDKSESLLKPADVSVLPTKKVTDPNNTINTSREYPTPPLDSTDIATETKSVSTAATTKETNKSTNTSANGGGGVKTGTVGPPTRVISNTSTSTTKSTATVVTASTTSSSGSRKKKHEKTKKQGKKRKADGSSRKGSETAQGYGDESSSNGPKKPGPKKGKKKKKTSDRESENSSIRRTLPTAASRDEPSTSGGKVKKSKKKTSGPKFSPAQAAMKDMMRQLLEEHKYSQKGSIVETDSSEDEDDDKTIFAIASGASTNSKRGHYGADATISMLRLDRPSITKAMRKRLRIEELRGVMDTSGVNKKRANSVVLVEEYNDNAIDASGDDDAKVGDNDSTGRGGRKKKRKKAKRNIRSGVTEASNGIVIGGGNMESAQDLGVEKSEQGDTNEDDDLGLGADESSIFGQTTGSSNATWVECDKCKKWRKLRGVVDAKKLPVKWFCSMNKKDPERSKCSAPEEEYEAANTPENVTDQRTRKHLRLWVRRLQCNENFESRLPTMTRGKKRNTTSAKEPYEWIRCCNPSCGKWRALLRSMDAASVIEAAKNGEWYCVLNTWDEKTASCAAPQENLPVIGCPPWVKRNDN